MAEVKFSHFGLTFLKAASPAFKYLFIVLNRHFWNKKEKILTKIYQKNDLILQKKWKQTVLND